MPERVPSIMKKLFLVLAVSLLFCGLFFGLTNPENVPIVVLMIPVILVFVVTTTAALIIMKLLSFYDRSPDRRKMLAVLSGVVAAFFLVFQSTGGVVLGDLILMGLIVVISYVYITKY